MHAGDAQVASPKSKESLEWPQRSPRNPQPNQTDHQDRDQDQDLDHTQSILPDISARSASGHALRWQTVDMFQQPGREDAAEAGAEDKDAHARTLKHPDELRDGI